MSAPSGEPTVAGIEGQPHPFDAKYAAPPPAPAAEPVAPEAEQDPEGEVPDWVKAKIAKANREAQNLRERLKEAEPLVKAAREAEEANKTEVQRAVERAQAAEGALAAAQLQAETNGLAAKYGLPETHFRYIVGNTSEDREAAAVGIAEMLRAARVPQVTPPPSNRPVEHLQPGASPREPVNTPPTEYPDWWIQQPRRGS